MLFPSALLLISLPVPLRTLYTTSASTLLPYTALLPSLTPFLPLALLPFFPQLRHPLSHPHLITCTSCPLPYFCAPILLYLVCNTISHGALPTFNLSVILSTSSLSSSISPSFFFCSSSCYPPFYFSQYCPKVILLLLHSYLPVYSLSSSFFLFINSHTCFSVFASSALFSHLNLLFFFFLLHIFLYFFFVLVILFLLSVLSPAPQRPSFPFSFSYTLCPTNPSFFLLLSLYFFPPTPPPFLLSSFSHCFSTPFAPIPVFSIIL